ncbi:GDSL-type esterase/lipase family protein [Streptomyces sp. BYX5S]
MIQHVRPLGGGTLEPAPRRPRWIVYGDSVVEGWVASRPSRAWPAVAGRMLGVEEVNLGYAGAARGEAESARQIAALDADLLTVAFGTNCWSRPAHSAARLYEVTRTFLRLVRVGHPGTPLLVVSPVLRPDAEDVPNERGATLAELRGAVERAARDAGVALLGGRGLLGAERLADGVHPDDEGHERIACAVAESLRCHGLLNDLIP